MSGYGLLAAPAQATLLFERGGDIWAMNDDGSGQQVLIPKSAAPGMSTIGSPHALASGGPVVFTGFTSQFRSGTFQYGDNATGVYVWNRGAIRRLSGPPGPCTGPAAPDCTSREVAPELTTNGRYVAELFVTTGSTADSVQSTSAIFSEALDGSGYQSHPTNCDDGLGDEGSDPSANPGNPAQIAYGGVKCGTYDVNTGVTTYSLWIDGTQFTDDGVLLDPSWRPDGGAVVWSETATGNTADASAGIWVSDGPGGAPRQVASLPAADILNAQGPRFVGNGTIVFSYDTNYDPSGTDPDGGRDLFALPASCNACTIDQATRLTSDGDSDEPAWTGASIADLLPPPSGSGGTGGGGTGGGGSAGGGDVAAPTVAASFSRRLRVGSVLRSGLPVSLTLDEPATVKVAIAVDRATIRKYRLLPGRRARRARSLTVGRITRRLGAGRNSVRVKLSKSYARKLRRARKLTLKVTITATDAAGNKTTTRRTVRLKR